MSFELTKQQKEEVRRLTQRANRRIAGAIKEYEKHGREVAPFEVTGGVQTKGQFETKQKPLSRTVKFETKKEYKDRLNFLRGFEDKGPGARPTMTEYKKVQKAKVREAVKTSLGVDLSEDLEKKLKKMSAPELADFWDKFERNAVRKGPQYSSEAVMAETLQEFFGEDIDALVAESE